MDIIVIGRVPAPWRHKVFLPSQPRILSHKHHDQFPFPYRIAFMKDECMSIDKREGWRLFLAVSEVAQYSPPADECGNSKSLTSIL